MHGSLSAVMQGVADSDLLKQTRNDAVKALNDATVKMAHVEELQAELKRQQGELSAQKALLADSTIEVR
jgi:hypothetical protein